MPLLLANSPGPSDSMLQALRHLDVEVLMLVLLMQVSIMILAARVFALLFRRLGQPSVVGEIAAGLILGPSILGRLFPEAFRAIFHPGLHGLPPELANPLLGWILTTLSQFGMIFLLFLIGLEFDFSHLRWHGVSAMSISLSGIVLPFVLGLGVAYYIHPLVGQEVEPLGFALFMGTAMSITAIPILGRIMMEMGIIRTRLGAITIAAAAVDDAGGWILLATIAATVRSGFRLVPLLIMLGSTVGFCLFMVFVVRPGVCLWLRSVGDKREKELGVNVLAILLVLLFVCALLTNLIGIFSIFGAFLFGAVLSDQPRIRELMMARVNQFVVAFFLPLFFAYTGLRTDIGTLDSWHLWLLTALVSAAAILGKFGGCGLAAWFSGFRRREAACIGVMMNTRALMALIVINVGKDLGVVPDSVFCMLVLMALLTTVITTPILMWMMRGTELEPLILSSGFIRQSRRAVEAPRVR